MTGPHATDEADEAIERRVAALLTYLLRRPGASASERLTDTHRVLTRFRCEQLDEMLAESLGDLVRRGPFAGMHLPHGWCDACYAPKLLGTYESEVQGIVASLPSRGYRTVINAGCAEGYYAVGLARMLANVDVKAFDSNKQARARCAELAAINGVAERVTIEGEVKPESFAGHPTPALVICDIEGAEDRVLDPESAPGLRGMDLLVEVHDCFVPETGARLVQRFSPSHCITTIASGSAPMPMLPELENFAHLDRLLAHWEGRLAGTYWLWMTTLGERNSV